MKAEYVPHIFEVYQENWPTRSYTITVLATDWDDAARSLLAHHLHSHNPRWIRLRQMAVIVGGRHKGQRGLWIWNKKGEEEVAA